MCYLIVLLYTMVQCLLGSPGGIFLAFLGLLGARGLSWSSPRLSWALLGSLGALLGSPEASWVPTDYPGASQQKQQIILTEIPTCVSKFFLKIQAVAARV